MQFIKYPPRENWSEILQRPSFDAGSLKERVNAILLDVKTNGDDAIRKYSQQFDGVSVDQLRVSVEEIEKAGNILDASLKKAIVQAHANILRFHLAQVQETVSVETMPGIRCWRKSVPIERVGLYIPGGTAPLFSTVLMLATPAAIAGCKEIILCSPPGKNGEVHPAILFAAKLTGVHSIFKVGGVQAIGAMAFGTSTIPSVYKIAGPGNQYVTCAKQLVQEWRIAIDMPAGPSEVCILADESANPAFVAADLLSQAEHGTDSQVLLVTDSEILANEVKIAVDQQLEQLPRKELAAASLKNSKLILVSRIEDGIDLVNAYAPEHLIISCKDDETVSQKIVNAGSIFLGNFTPESVGDYASGTNHTLPTNGYARAYSGVSVDSFVKKITYQKLTPEGLKNISTSVIEMAEAEGLKGHANSVRIRFGKAD